MIDALFVVTPCYQCRYAYLDHLDSLKGRQKREEGDKEDRRGTAALSVAQTADNSSWALSDKGMEAAAYLRFLRTQRNRLKVSERNEG